MKRGRIDKYEDDSMIDYDEDDDAAAYVPPPSVVEKFADQNYYSSLLWNLINDLKEDDAEKAQLLGIPEDQFRNEKKGQIRLIDDFMSSTKPTDMEKKELLQDYRNSFYGFSPEYRAKWMPRFKQLIYGKGKIHRKKGKMSGGGKGKRITGRGKTTKGQPPIFVGSSPHPSYDLEAEHRKKKEAIMADLRKLGVAEKDLPPMSLSYPLLESIRQAQQDVVDSKKEYAKLIPLFKRPRPMPIPRSLEPGEIDLAKILADAEFSKHLAPSP